MGIPSKRTGYRFALLIIVLSLSVLAMSGTAAAGDAIEITNSSSPEDVPTQDSDVTQNLTADGPISINTTANGTTLAVEFDIGDTPVLDAVTSETEVNVTKRNSSTNFNGVSGINTEDGVVFFTADADAPSSDPFQFSPIGGSENTGGSALNATVTLEGLDTTELETETNLEYTLRASGDPDDTFTESEITKIDRARPSTEFNLAFIEVVDESDGDRDVVTNISDSFKEFDNGKNLEDIDLDQDTTINIGRGTYTPDDVDVVNDSITVQPAGDGVVIFQAETNVGGSMFNMSTTDDVTFRDVVFDFDRRSDLTRAVNVSQEAGDITFDNVTFRSPADSAQDAITVSNASGSLTVTGSTFDARPDTDGATTAATAINVTDYGTFAGSSDHQLTVEESSFDGYGNGTVSDIGNSSLGSDIVTVDSVTINNNEFANTKIHYEKIGAPGTTDLDTVFSGNDFDKFVTLQDSAGDIINATFGELGEAMDRTPERGINMTDRDNLRDRKTLEITGTHDTNVDSSINVTSNSTVVTSPDGSAEIEVASDSVARELISLNTSHERTTDTALTNVEISGLSITPQATGNTFAINDTASNGGANPLFIDELVIADNTFNLEGIEMNGVEINTTNVRNSEFTNNEFARANDEIAYGGALNFSAIEFEDTGDQTTVTIADNEVTGAGSGFNVTANEKSDNNLEIEINDNTIQLAESATNGINLTVEDVASASVTENNFISIDDADVEQFGTDGIALNVTVRSSGEASKVEITDNEFTNIANDSLRTDRSGRDAGTAIKLNDAAGGGNNNDPVTISGNTLEGSDIHLNLSTTGAGFDESDIPSLVNQNTVSQDVRVLDNTENADDVERTDGNDIAEPAAYGTFSAAVIDSIDTEAVNADSGTYTATGITVRKNIFIESSAGPDATTFTTDEDESFFDVQADATVEGFTFSPTADNDAADVILSNNAPNLVNNVFNGPVGDNRKAITVSTDSEIEISENTITGYAEAIEVTGGDGHLQVTENTISNNNVGVFLADNAGQRNDDVTAAIKFNNIVGNTIGINADDPNFKHVNATANWWGDQSGPSGDDAPIQNVGIGDEVIDDYSDGMNVTPWLDDSLDTLPESGYAVVQDPRDRIASDQGDEQEVAKIVVATLDATEESDASGETVLTADPSSGISLTDRFDGDGTANASDPATFNATATETGDYTLTARHTTGAVAQGSAVQPFVGPAADVLVTSDSDTLIADGESTANVTLQVVDDNDNPVNKANLDTQFLVDNSSNANVTQNSVDAETDVNGQAELTISAETAGFDVEVTGVEDTNTGASDTTTIETVEPASADFQLELIDGPTQIVQNESYSATVEVTNNGTGTGTQDISYVLEDSAGLSSGIEAVEESVELDPGESQQVAFEVTAEDTDALETGTFTHVFESNDDEVSLDAEVVEERIPDATVTFDDQSVQSGATSVNVASATFNGSEAFNIVVHQATDDNNDGTIQASEIGTKIGESAELDSGTSTDITVNISKQVADNDDVSQLTEDQTLVAMLHTTNTSDDDNIVHTAPITRDGTPVFDQAEITVEETVNVGGEDVPAEFTTTENGETTVTADNAVSAIDTFIAGDINADTAVSVIDAFIASQS